MSVNWGTFKRNIKDYLASYKAKSGADLANKIADEYESAILGATDLVTGNSPLTYNKAGLLSALVTAFSNTNHANQVEANLFIEQNINMGIIVFWTGATLTSTNVIPGITSFTPPCQVLVPGVCMFKMPVVGDNSSSPGFDGLPNNMADAFKAHLLTLSGVHSSANPPPPAVPILLFPWIGME